MRAKVLRHWGQVLLSSSHRVMHWFPKMCPHGSWTADSLPDCERVTGPGNWKGSWHIVQSRSSGAMVDVPKGRSRFWISSVREDDLAMIQKCGVWKYLTIEHQVIEKGVHHRFNPTAATTDHYTVSRKQRSLARQHGQRALWPLAWR